MSIKLKKISSTANERIKSFLRHRNAHYRRQNNTFIIEGIKEISLALKFKYQFREIYFCDEIISLNKVTDIFQKYGVDINKIINVSKHVFAKMVYRENSQGIVAIAERMAHKLDMITLSDNPFLLVVEKVEKPGNLGAIFRTADAVNIDGIIFCDLDTDIYNPNVIRASLGAIFNVPFAVEKNKEALLWLRKNKIQIYSTSLKSNTNIYETNYQPPIAFVVGSEAKGLSDFWLNNADKEIIIPMHGQADSLNTSVTVALLLYEMLRQQKFNISF